MTNATIRELELPDIGSHPENFWRQIDLLPGVEHVSWSGPFDSRPTPDLSDCLARTLPGRPWLLQLWEPIHTKAPSPARCQPYCCYIRTVIFYHRPYIVDRHHGFTWFDKVETRLSWDDVVEFEGTQFTISGGSVNWDGKRWWMKRTCRRVAE